MKAPKRRSKDPYNPHWVPPDAEWLEYQLCVLKKSASVVAEEIGANRKTVDNWIAELGVVYWGQKRHPVPEGMIAPNKETSAGGKVTWYPPSRDWLVNQHHILQRSVHAIAESLGTTHDVVLRWLGRADVERVRRYPSGPQHLNWKEEGHSRPRSHARKVLRWEGISEVCFWCGCKGKLEAHHRNHDLHDNDPENLQWLCYHCNCLEAHLWYVHNLGKAIVEAEGDTITIRFPYLEGK